MALILHLAIKETHAHSVWIVKISLFVITPLLWVFVPSLCLNLSHLPLFLHLWANVEWQWLTVAVILVIRKGQVESSHTLTQWHITPWNNPQGTFTLVSKSHSNPDATFQFIHVIAPPSVQRERKFLAPVCCRASVIHMSHEEDLIGQLRMAEACRLA